MVLQILSFNRCLISFCLVAYFFVITACIPTPPNTPLVTPTCISPTLGANPYTAEVAQEVKDIYERSFINLGNARQEALFQLGRNMEYRSAQVDIVNDNAHMVRIIVTYLDPVLIQYVVLNHELNDSAFLPNVVDSPTNANTFYFDLGQRLKKLSELNEMLFIVTITSPFYHWQIYNSTDLIVKLPIDEMTLNSASNMQVKPTHADHILNENMDLNQGSVSGIVGYPIAIQLSKDQCSLIIDQWTNTLTLDIPAVTLGATSYSQKFWNISYRPLITQNETHPTPTTDPFILGKPIGKLPEPPTPSWTPNPGFDNTVSQMYWEEMGRYIWNMVITQSHP